MKKKIVVLNADQPECRKTCTLLEAQNYPALPMHSLAKLDEVIRKGDIQTVFIDIDTVPVDNRFIRELAIRNPGTYILCASKDKFNPELKDAICYHIYACMNKPLNPDELFYWLSVIEQ